MGSGSSRVRQARELLGAVRDLYVGQRLLVVWEHALYHGQPGSVAEQRSTRLAEAEIRYCGEFVGYEVRDPF